MSNTAALEGQYYDGRQPIGTPARLVITGREATLSGAQLLHSYSTRQLSVSPRVGRADRFIHMPNGGQFQCADQALLDRLPQQGRAEGVVAWLEARWGVAIAGIVAIVSLLAGGYFLGLPVVAERIAARIPIETQQALGEQVLAWLDHNGGFAGTRLDAKTQGRIAKGFARLHAGLPLEDYYRLEFRSSDFIGPNAFALPGGTVVITDAMVHLAQNVDEVLAVLAHEIGHAERHHAMRQLLQGSAVAVVAVALTADAASLSVAVAGLPALLARTKYSRGFETEADEFAFTLLKQHGLSPEAFATIMERLNQKYAGKTFGLAFLSTHPVTAERVARARAAVRQD